LVGSVEEHLPLYPKYSNFGVFSSFELVVTSLTVRRSFGLDAVNVTLLPRSAAMFPNPGGFHGTSGP